MRVFSIFKGDCQIIGRRPMFQKLTICVNYLAVSHCKYTVDLVLNDVSRQNEAECRIKPCTGALCVSKCTYTCLPSPEKANASLTPLGVTSLLEIAGR